MVVDKFERYQALATDEELYPERNMAAIERGNQNADQVLKSQRSPKQPQSYRAKAKHPQPLQITNIYDH